MPDWAAKRIDDMEAIYLGSFKRARAELGLEAFGVQVIDMGPNEHRHPEHDHLHDDQEELYVVLHGSGDIELEGERQPLDVHRLVRVGPTVKRKLWPGEEGMRVLIVGGVPGRPYEAPEISQLGGPDPMAQEG